MRLIDADDLIRRVREFQQIDLNHKAAPYCWAYAYECFENDIDEQPTIEAEPVRRGRWINHGSFVTCSVCNEEQYGIDTGRFYCQNCGARMEVENETN